MVFVSCLWHSGNASSFSVYVLTYVIVCLPRLFGVIDVCLIIYICWSYCLHIPYSVCEASCESLPCFELMMVMMAVCLCSLSGVCEAVIDALECIVFVYLVGGVCIYPFFPVCEKCAYVLQM